MSELNKDYIQLLFVYQDACEEKDPDRKSPLVIIEEISQILRDEDVEFGITFFGLLGSTYMIIVGTNEIPLDELTLYKEYRTKPGIGITMVAVRPDKMRMIINRYYMTSDGVMSCATNDHCYNLSDITKYESCKKEIVDDIEKLVTSLDDHLKCLDVASCVRLLFSWFDTAVLLKVWRSV